MQEMNCLRIIQKQKSQLSYPTGSKDFAVQQAFPAAISAEEADPFLMLDHFGPTINKRKEPYHADEFQVGWHPHRGQDLLTYMLSGVIRHADSMGNRGECSTPGAQWISAGSGIEHAEGGGVPYGETSHGFQIWVNVPSKNKMDDPKYGTQPPETLPLIIYNTNNNNNNNENNNSIDNSNKNASTTTARVLSGPFTYSPNTNYSSSPSSPSSSSSSSSSSFSSFLGPFLTQTPTSMVDFVVGKGQTVNHIVSRKYDQLLMYVYEGKGVIQDVEVELNDVVRFNANENTNEGEGEEKERVVRMSGSRDKGMGLLMFAGVQLKQKIAWHGPFVMTTDEEIKSTLREYREGTFLKKRSTWDYKKISTKPKHDNNDL